MKYLSTFSGIGGFEKGIQQAYENNLCRRNRNSENPESETSKQGLETTKQDSQRQWDSTSTFKLGDTGEVSCIGYSEIDKYAIQTYEKHFPTHHNYGDITKINADELPDFDLLVGGFPCQSFSIAGKRRGFEDTRGTLFFDLARILSRKQPRLFVFENVKGLLSHNDGQTFRTIIATLTELGYDVQWQVINSKNHGVPQNRERVFIIGHLRGTRRPEVFPFGNTHKQDTKYIQGHITNTLTARYEGAQATGTYIGEGKFNAQEIKVEGYLTSEKWDNFNESSRRVYNIEGISPTIPTVAGGGHTPKIRIHEATKKGYAEATVGQSINLSVPNSKTRRGRVSDTGMQQHTLTEDMKIRRLTPTECERLQGFPDGWTEGVSDTQRYKQCGNAVTVNVIKDIMEKLLIN